MAPSFPPFHFTSVLCNGQVQVFQNSMSKCIAATFLENILTSLYCYIDIQFYNIAHIKHLALQFKDLLRFPCYALRGYFWKHRVNRFSTGKFKDTMGIWDSPGVLLQQSLNCNVLELHELYRYNYSVSRIVYYYYYYYYLDIVFICAVFVVCSH